MIRFESLERTNEREENRGVAERISFSLALVLLVLGIMSISNCTIKRSDYMYVSTSLHAATVFMRTARCKSLPERPAHGFVIAPKTDHGMRALFRCTDGYQLVGPNVTVCQFGNWTHEAVPLCRESE